MCLWEIISIRSHLETKWRRGQSNGPAEQLQYFHFFLDNRSRATFWDSMFCNTPDNGSYLLYLSVLEMLLITSRSEEKSSMARHSSLTAPVDTNRGKISSSPATLRKAPVSWNKAWLVCSGMREPSTRCKEKWTLYQLLWLTKIIRKCKDDVRNKGRSRSCYNIAIINRNLQ
jgi:hypothetical protein